MSQREIVVWVDERWCKALEQYLLDGSIAEKLEEHIDELVNKMEDFRKAYFTGALKSEEYHDFGPVELFCSSFRGHWKKELEIIKEERNR